MTDKYIKTYLKLTSRYIKAMFDLSTNMSSAEILLSPTFNNAEELTVCIPFSGSISGEYFLSINEQSCSNYLTKVLGDGTSATINSCLKELLNTIVGDAITELQEDYPDLTFLSPRIFRGSLDYPEVLTFSSILLSQETTPIHIALSLNMMKQNISLKLEDSYNCINDEKAKVNSIMSSLRQGIFSISHSGEVSPASLDLKRGFELQTNEKQTALQGIVFQPDFTTQKCNISKGEKTDSVDICLKNFKGSMKIKNKIEEKATFNLSLTQI